MNKVSRTAAAKASTTCAQCAVLFLHYARTVTIEESGRTMKVCPECARDMLARLSGNDAAAELECESLWRLATWEATVPDSDEGDADVFP